MIQDNEKIFKEDAAKKLFFLLKRNLGVEVAHSEPIFENLSQIIGGAPDFLQKITTTTGEEFILHAEFRLVDDHNMLEWMQQLHALVCEQYDLPIYQWVIYGGEHPSKMEHTLPPEQQFRGYELVKAHDRDTKEFLNGSTPEKVVWGMFSGFDNSQAYDIITQIIERLCALTNTDELLEKYIFQLITLARLRNLTKVTQQVLKDMPINFDIEKDAFYQEGIEKGKEEGILQTALRMKKAGFSAAEIVVATGLTKEQVAQL